MAPVDEIEPQQVEEPAGGRPKKGVLLNLHPKFLERVDRAVRSTGAKDRTAFLVEAIRVYVLAEEDRQLERRRRRMGEDDGHGAPRPMSAIRPGRSLRESREPEPSPPAPSTPTIQVVMPGSIDATVESLAAFYRAAEDEPDRDRRSEEIIRIIAAQPEEKRRRIADALDKQLGLSTAEGEPRHSWMTRPGPSVLQRLPDPVGKVSKWMDDLFGGKGR